MSRELFEKWLKENTKLVEGTIYSYGSAISSVSNFGIKEKIIHQDIYEIRDATVLNEMLNLLESSELYNEKNLTSNRRWSSALEQYKQFIMAVGQVDNGDDMNIKDINHISGTNLKDEFDKWMSNQIQNNGEPYSPLTQRGYIYALERACSEIKDLSLKTEIYLILFHMMNS